ncbi:hypothetical protein J3U21_11455 [Gilliamella sp. B2776]|uniref:hypothetical protein n=2 Tax=Gilliamella TaxID=1193503 RepID=UPI00226A56D5|nr:MULTISPECIES: hypothetical protein [unclassified Gilliamella]MCX8650948.1 hypothetical protein [Gilliamella sp. B2779]MCX8653823.1 hypothetical protein [Gilliamella sp. B2737]MCX8657370.1 hypothetical protein [Gilliamella sp. B2894]MCX8692769.1 hypothetical protein [Gilliamella sp. B2776]MCX8703914.1 hypothetical protein [Gilliamella sp. B2781]
MAECSEQNSQLFGAAVVLEVCDGCPDKTPKEADWKALMAGKSKGIDYGPNTATSDADDQGGFAESIVINADIALSFEGEVRVNDKLDQYGFFKLERYFTTELANKRQPSLWVRLMYGENTFVAYMNITSLSWNGGSNDIVSASLEFKVASSKSVKITGKIPTTQSTK